MNQKKMFKPLIEALYFFRTFGMPVWGIFFLSGIGGEWFYLMVTEGQQSDFNRGIAQALIASAIEPLAASIALVFIHQVSINQPATLTSSFRQALPYYPRLLVTFMLGGALILAGLTLYILPGIYLMYKLLFAELHVILENKQPIDAMRASFKQTKDKAEKIVPIFLPIILSIFLVEGISDHLMKDWLDPATSVIAKRGVIAIPSALLAIVVYRLYSLTRPHPLSPS